VDNHARFLIGVAEAVGADRAGVRVSPANSFNDVLDHETEQTYAAVVAGLQPRERVPRLSTRLDQVAMAIWHTRTTTLESAGSTALRSGLALNLLWIGLLKFDDYEVENIRPLISSSPLFSRLVKRLGERRVAQLIGVAEIAMGSAIAAKPIAPRVSTIGSLGAVGTFLITLSFLGTTPGVWQEGRKAPKLSMTGQFLVKDSVLLGASLLTAAESLKAARRR
jgi:uncharacterized membrane protein YkgB